MRSFGASNCDLMILQFKGLPQTLQLIFKKSLWQSRSVVIILIAMYKLIFFIELPLAATYGASKHALQVCNWYH